MTRLTITAIVLLNFILIPFKALAHDYKTPEAAVQTYIKAVKTGSGDLIEMAFQPTAHIQYYNPKGEMQQFTRDEFAKVVDTGNTWEADIKIAELKKTGFAANATVEFVWGEQQQHGYTDYLNLIWDGKSWHISDKIAQYTPLN
jgi:hypothetical protein